MVQYIKIEHREKCPSCGTKWILNEGEINAGAYWCEDCNISVPLADGLKEKVEQKVECPSCGSKWILDEGEINAGEYWCDDCHETVSLSHQAVFKSPDEGYSGVVKDSNGRSSGGNRSSFGVGCLLIGAYGIAQIVGGFIGIQHHFGGGWAIAAIVVACLFRFTLPITVGSFFGALNVWGWHWFPSLIFAAPGLAFLMLMVPGAMADLKHKYR